MPALLLFIFFLLQVATTRYDCDCDGCVVNAGLLGWHPIAKGATDQGRRG